MDLVDDAKDKIDEVTDNVSNNLHEMKGQAEGYQKGRDDSSKVMCNCGRDGCTCAAGECDC